MLRSMFRVIFSLAVTLSLTFGIFSGFGTSLASSCQQPTHGCCRIPPGRLSPDWSKLLLSKWVQPARLEMRLEAGHVPV